MISWRHSDRNVNCHIKIWNHLRPEYIKKEIQASQARKLEFSFMTYFATFGSAEYLDRVFNSDRRYGKRATLKTFQQPNHHQQQPKTQSHCRLCNTLTFQCRALDVKPALYGICVIVTINFPPFLNDTLLSSVTLLYLHSFTCLSCSVGGIWRHTDS